MHIIGIISVFLNIYLLYRLNSKKTVEQKTGTGVSISQEEEGTDKTKPNELDKNVK